MGILPGTKLPLVVRGAAVHEAELPHLVAVDDLERDTTAMLVGPGTDGLASADCHERRAPDLVVARARLDRDEPRGTRLGLLVVGHEGEPAVAELGGAKPHLAAVRRNVSVTLLSQ